VKISPPPALLKRAQQFPPSVKEGEYFDVPDRIIAHLTKICQQSACDHTIVAVTTRSFEKTTVESDGDPKRDVDLESDSSRSSDYRTSSEDVPHRQNNRRLSKAKELRRQNQESPCLSNDLGELIAVVGLQGGSGVTGGLSARGPANVAVRDSSDDFTFIIGNHRYRCRSSVAQFLSPRVSELRLIDATISELRLEVEDRDDLFGSVLEAARGDMIAVDSAHRLTFLAICAGLWNS
jgi:hypothetical protein